MTGCIIRHHDYDPPYDSKFYMTIHYISRLKKKNGSVFW